MAVKFGMLRSKDTSNGRIVDVHMIKVTSSNKKGAAEAVGGKVVTLDDGDFYIEVPSTIGKKKVKLIVQKNHFIFRTGQNNRWQSLSTKGFNDRFKLV